MPTLTLLKWLNTQGLIPTLLSFLSPEHPASVQTSAGDFLKAIITISANATQNEQSCIGPNSLTRELVSAQCVDTLIKAMLKGGNPLTVGVGIVIEVIRKNNSDYDPEIVGGPDSLPTTYDPIYLGALLRLFAQHVPDFMGLILSSSRTVNDDGKVKSVDRGKLNSAWGAKIEPLGFDRFKTCELMAELLHYSNMGLLNEPGSDDYVRNRDAERERLIKEGVFNPQREGASGVDYNDSTAEFTNGSVYGSGSPGDVKGLEITNAGEEDSFEDVSASGVLVDQEKDEGRENSQGLKTDQAPAGASAQSTSAQEPDGSKDKSESKGEETESTSTEATQPSGPVSPATSGLAHQIGNIRLDNDGSQGCAPESKQTDGESGKLESSVNRESATSPDTSAPMASNPEAIPAPLFASKQETSTSPDGAPESDVVARTASEQEQQSEQTHPFIQLDTNGQPVVGDYLKIMFVQNRVVPTILVGICSSHSLTFAD